MTYGLVRAEVLPGRPPWLANDPRKLGSKAKGLLFERRVGAILRRLWPRTQSGQWLAYRDWAGDGVCQPDHFVERETDVLLVECKLTEREDVWDQVSKYSRVLEALCGKPATEVLAVRNLTRTVNPIVDVREAPLCGRSVWHTLG